MVDIQIARGHLVQKTTSYAKINNKKNYCVGISFITRIYIFNSPLIIQHTIISKN